MLLLQSTGIKEAGEGGTGNDLPISRTSRRPRKFAARGGTLLVVSENGQVLQKPMVDPEREAREA